jgi:hypothetical protein
MTQWVGDNWRLRAGPQPDATQDQNESADDDTKVDPEIRLRGYKESFVREYDGIRVYHHQGRYQHQTEQFHYWAFYEYRMMINGECWNIITDEDMVKPPGSFPGSSSSKLTHDFCHLETRYCDDEYTSFSFVDMAGHKIWPFYTSENFQEHLWIWVSPRRFAIISGHPTNEKLNHFYSNKMHEHHILANRTICWSVDTVVNDNGIVIERTIAPSEDTRLRSASHETFVTGFEDKYFTSPGGRKEDGSYGKRKHSDSTGQAKAKQFDPTNTYSGRDMQAWDEAFADPPRSTAASTSQPRVPIEGVQWTYGQVPALESETKDGDRSTTQLAYARTLLSVVMEAAMQLETVVENLEQLNREKNNAEGVAQEATPDSKTTESKDQGTEVAN